MIRKEIDSIFDKLDKWRTFPDYQLERRSDIFFALFMEDILKIKYDNLKIDCIIPEFPIRKGTILESNINQSVKLDYVVLSQQKVFFIELKTDMKSINFNQLEYIRKAKISNIPQLVNGILEIYRVTRSKIKYSNLLDSLLTIDWVSKHSNNYSNKAKNYKIEIIYIQPESSIIDDVEVITFTEIAKILRNKDSLIANRFSKSLTKWVNPVNK